MDWFSWLSKTSLDPSLIYEYGLTFAHNELEQEDIPYFNHECLKSMGISVAKHRLEILKLASKVKISRSPRPMKMLFVAVKKTKKCLSECVHRWKYHDDRAIVVVPASPSYSTPRWKSVMVKRNKKFTMPEPTRLMLTNSSPLLLPAPPVDHNHNYLSPVVFDAYKEENMVKQCDDVYDDTRGVEETIRWDAMFRDLKPT